MIGDLARKLMGGNLKATIAAALALGGGALGVVTNGKQLMDIVDGTEDAKIAMAEKAVEGQKETATLIASAVAETEATKADARAWAVATETNTPASYAFYLATYPNGMFATQAAKAKADLEARGAGSPFAVERAGAVFGPAIEAARAAKANALARQAESETVAASAESAAEQAKAGARGYRVISLRDGSSYAGQVERGQPNGVGVMTVATGPAAGDRYAGAVVDGRWQGLGVFEAGQPGEARPKRYAGEFQNGQLGGAGLMTLADGARAMGPVVNGRLSGSATVIYPDGRVFEGEFRGGRRNGLGVLWTPAGSVLERGRYADDVLVDATVR
ncbi:MAG: hypothetical protein KJS97_11035 [Alphaproteobacteria bacterium]|nr:hypothetical protein [Alphaproteobacteria bacterium]